MRGQIVKGRKRERGVPIVITAVALVVMLAMAALAIDVVTLYVASGEAQKNADAAALAGAKAFVSSGFTSWQLGDPTTGAAQAKVCNGTTGLADYQAQAAAQKNLIAGTVPTTVTTTCTFSSGTQRTLRRSCLSCPRMRRNNSTDPLRSSGCWQLNNSAARK